MKKPNKHSPNWYWQQLGATITHSVKGVNPRYRTITLDGRIVCEGAGHSGELQTAKRLLNKDS